jgi:hypothetical protein
VPEDGHRGQRRDRRVAPAQGLQDPRRLGGGEVVPAVGAADAQREQAGVSA